MHRLRYIPILLILMLMVSPALGAGQQQETIQVTGPETAAKLSYQTMEDGRLLVSVTNDQDEPIMGLTKENFSVGNGQKAAKIESVEPLATSKQIGLNIVMVIDNSASMEMRNAVNPLREALSEFYKTIRPIDQVYVVVFDDRKTVSLDGKKLHAKMIKSSNPDELRGFIADSLDDGLTDGTYLYDGMVLGLSLVRQMPEKSNKFMVVFSDGQDLNSSAKRPDVEKAAEGLANFSSYAVDYMPGNKNDPFLKRFSGEFNGRLWKAGSATELLPVFQAFSSTLLHRYVITYRFLEAPTGTVAFGTPALTVEEVTTIDSSPLLNYIFFETGKSELPARYHMFQRQSETDAFAEETLRGAMEKYTNVLNIIGYRMRANADANLRIVGCNSNIDEEKGRTDLSLQRAESVKAYLRYVWNIDPARLKTEHRNLPEAPSSNRTPEGRIENQRVEIYADNPAILDTVNSEYVQKVSDQNQLQLVPAIESEAGIADWTVTLHCGQRVLHTFNGQGELPAQLAVPLEATLLEQITTCDSVRSSIKAVDKEQNVLEANGNEILPVQFLQRKEQMAQVQGYKVKEQYALILFDYNSSAVKERNKEIVDRIVRRMQQIPRATAAIVGHTDILGKEEYNMTLSQKRADAVQEQILAAARDEADMITAVGSGPHNPLYDNELPEGRALNRTVTITLEYQQTQ